MKSMRTTSPGVVPISSATRLASRMSFLSIRQRNISVMSQLCHLLESLSSLDRGEVGDLPFEFASGWAAVPVSREIFQSHHVKRIEHNGVTLPIRDDYRLWCQEDELRVWDRVLMAGRGNNR